MQTNRKSRFQLRLASTSFVVLLLTVVGLLVVSSVFGILGGSPGDASPSVDP